VWIGRAAPGATSSERTSAYGIGSESSPAFSKQETVTSRAVSPGRLMTASSCSRTTRCTVPRTIEASQPRSMARGAIDWLLASMRRPTAASRTFAPWPTRSASSCRVGRRHSPYAISVAAGARCGGTKTNFARTSPVRGRLIRVARRRSSSAPRYRGDTVPSKNSDKYVCSILRLPKLNELSLRLTRPGHAQPVDDLNVSSSRLDSEERHQGGHRLVDNEVDPGTATLLRRRTTG
jgi:hypothetical protein